MSFLRVLLILCALTCVDATGAEREVRIGVIDTFNPHFSSETLGPTLAFMRAKLPQYDFVTDTIHTAKPVESMKDRKVDFFIATAGIFSELQQTIGAKHIATRRRTQAGNPAESVASVFIVKAERRDLKTFADLKGKKVVASQSNSFDGWQIAMGRLADEGYDWRTFFSERRFTHFQIPDVVLDVLSGNADVGIIGACTLENLESEGWIEKDALRVVGDKSDGTFPCRRSTDLYPDIVVGALEEARADVVRDVTVALLTMPPESNYDWSVASNFKAVNDLFRKLEIGQYAYLHDRRFDKPCMMQRLEAGARIVTISDRLLGMNLGEEFFLYRRDSITGRTLLQRRAGPVDCADQTLSEVAVAHEGAVSLIGLDDGSLRGVKNRSGAGQPLVGLFYIWGDLYLIRERSIHKYIP